MKLSFLLQAKEWQFNSNDKQIIELDGTELSSSLDVDSCYMLNDWESIGYCLPLLHESDLVSIKSGDRNTNQTSLQ